MVYPYNEIFFKNWKKNADMLQHEWILKMLCYVKNARHKKKHIVWFLYEISRLGKSVGRENRSVVARGLGEEKLGVKKTFWY